MRVLFLAPQPFYRLRGMCIAQKSCLEALSRLGAQVDVLTYPFGEDVEIPGVRILRLPRLPGLRDVPIGPSRQKLLLAPLMLAAAAILLLRARYDAVQACEESALLMTLLPKFLRFRLVYDMDEVLSARLGRSGFFKSALALSIIRRWERAALRRADFVLTNSRDTTDYALRFARPGRVHFYHHAPPLPDAAWTASQREAFRRARGWEGLRIILYAGNLEPYQGVELLLDSLPLVFARRGDARCVVVGGEPGQIERLRELARARGLSVRIEFLGRRSLAESFQMMKAADTLVSPAIEEKAVPMKLYAYLAAGVPVVATDLPNHAQLLAGARLPAPSPRELADALCAALSSAARPAPRLLPGERGAEAALRAMRQVCGSA